MSDLLRRRPIWFGGKDRSEDSSTKLFAAQYDRPDERIAAGRAALGR